MVGGGLMNACRLGGPHALTPLVHWWQAHTCCYLRIPPHTCSTVPSKQPPPLPAAEALQKSGVRYSWPAMEGLGGPTAASLGGAAAGESAGVDPGLKLL